MPQIEARTRAQIARFLPKAIQTALLSYQEFSQDADFDDAKEFKSHHDACKVAIAHVELLIKLAQWADLPDPKAEVAETNAMLRGLIETAQVELDGHRSHAE